MSKPPVGNITFGPAGAGPKETPVVLRGPAMLGTLILHTSYHLRSGGYHTRIVMPDGSLYYDADSMERFEHNDANASLGAAIRHLSTLPADLTDRDPRNMLEAYVIKVVLND